MREVLVFKYDLIMTYLNGRPSMRSEAVLLILEILNGCRK